MVKRKKRIVFLSLILMLIIINPSITSNVNLKPILNSTKGSETNSPWPMYGNDVHNTGRSEYFSNNNIGIRLWRYTTRDSVEGGIVIDDEGSLYFGDTGKSIYALYPNGTLKWDKYMSDYGFKTTPLLDNNGTAYFTSSGSKGIIYAIDTNSGKQLWTYKNNSGGGIFSSPTLGENNTIYFTDFRGYLNALSTDGTLKWRYKYDKSESTALKTSPSIGDDGTIYVTSKRSSFYAINSNGTLKWKYETPRASHGEKAPTITDDGLILFPSNGLYAFYSNGTLKWKAKIKSSTTPALGSDGTIYCGDYKLYAIDPTNGSIKWTYSLDLDQSFHYSNPCISADDIIYFGTEYGVYSGGYIISVNSDGTERWRHKISNDYVRSPPCIGKDGIVYIGSRHDDVSDTDGYVYAFGGGTNYAPRDLTIDGETQGRIDYNYTFDISASDSEGNAIKYKIDWGDGTNTGWIGPYPNKRLISFTHNWSIIGDYLIGVQAKDVFGSVALDEFHNILIEDNNPPEKPIITGKTNGTIDKYYTYEFISKDPEKDEIKYFIEWGDGNTSGKWIGPFPSGEKALISHEWKIEGSYIIRAKSRDEYGLESEWSDPLTITMPKTKNPSFPFLDWLIERFPFFKVSLDILMN